MGASTMVFLDAALGDLRELDQSGDLARSVGANYCECMLENFGVHRSNVDVRTDRDSDSGIVELSGPWDAISRVGKSSLALSTVVKWGVFLSDTEERISILREVLCLTKVFASTKVVIFSSDSSAYDFAIEGGGCAAVLGALELGWRRFAFSVSPSDFVEFLTTKILDLGDDMDGGYLEIDIEWEPGHQNLGAHNSDR